VQPSMAGRQGAVDAETTAGGQDAERKVRVECEGVMLKLTLSAKQMQKPIAEAIVRPFLKAYSKKKGLEKEVDVKDVAQVTVDSDGQTQLQVLNDIHIYTAAQCLEKLRGDVDFDVYLKRDAPPASAPATPKKPATLPKDTRVLIHGLTSRAGESLNGSEGRLTGFNPSTGRYEVTLKNDGRVVSCKMENVMDLGQHQV